MWCALLVAASQLVAASVVRGDCDGAGEAFVQQGVLSFTTTADRDFPSPKIETLPEMLARGGEPAREALKYMVDDHQQRNPDLEALEHVFPEDDRPFEELLPKIASVIHRGDPQPGPTQVGSCGAAAFGGTAQAAAQQLMTEHVDPEMLHDAVLLLGVYGNREHKYWRDAFSLLLLRDDGGADYSRVRDAAAQALGTSRMDAPAAVDALLLDLVARDENGPKCAQEVRSAAYLALREVGQVSSADATVEVFQRAANIVETMGDLLQWEIGDDSDDDDDEDEDENPEKQEKAMKIRLFEVFVAKNKAFKDAAMDYEQKYKITAGEHKESLKKVVFILLFLFALICVGYHVYLALNRKLKNLHLWDFNGKSFRSLTWEACGAYESAKLPSTHGFYTVVQQLFEEYGGQNCERQTVKQLESVRVLRNWDLIALFEGCLAVSQRQRQSDPDFFVQTRAASVAGVPQKNEIMKRFETLRQRHTGFFGEEAEDGALSLLATFHGTSEAAAASIAANGAKDFRVTDPGYAGAGIYTTLQAQYAAQYSEMTRSNCMLLCAVCVGNVYPISRDRDYDAPKEYYLPGGGAAHSKFFDSVNHSGCALKPRYDAHWFTVHAPSSANVDCECFMSQKSFPPDYDEVVVKEQCQVLPLAVLHFKDAEQSAAAPVVR